MLLDLLVYSSKGLTSFMELELIFLPLNTDIKFLALSEYLARKTYFQSPPDFRIDYKVFYQARKSRDHNSDCDSMIITNSLSNRMSKVLGDLC